VKKYLPFSLLIILFLAACGVGQTDSEKFAPTSTGGSLSTTTRALSATAIRRFIPTFASPTSRPTATSVWATALEYIQNALLDFLDQGKTPAQIIEALQTPRRDIQISPVDLNNDGSSEIVVMVVESSSSIADPLATTWVFEKSGTSYRTIYFDPRESRIQAKIIASDDINGDGRQELVLQDCFYSPMGWCGLNVYVLGMTDGQIVDYFEGNSPNIDSPGEVKLGDKVGGFRKLLINGSTATSWGAGPSRGSNYRIHVLQDAQIAFKNGDINTALQLWDRAAHDASLENFPSLHFYETDHPERYQPAYALYRIYCEYLLEGEAGNAQQVLNELKSKYPENSPGGEFISVAAEMKRLLSTDQNPANVCPAIYGFIDNTFHEDFRIYRWDYGYNNPDIIIFCPLNW
jgi:hypothetical protein